MLSRGAQICSRLFVALVVLCLILISCEWSEDPTDELPPLVVDVIPVFGLSQAADPLAQSKMGARAVIPDSMSWAEAQYYLMAPILYSFEPNYAGKAVGDSFTVSFFDTEIIVTISEESCTIIFDGQFVDNTGEVRIAFDPVGGIFGYEQTIVFADPSNKIEIPGATFFHALIHTTMDNVTLESDNSFHEKFKTYVFEYFGNDSDATSLFVGTEEVELRHGDMVDESGASFRGTGYAAYQYRSLGNYNEVISGFAAAPTMADKDRCLVEFAQYAGWGPPITFPQYCYFNEGTGLVVHENYMTDYVPDPDYPASFQDFLAGLPWTDSMLVEMP